jgi:GTP:adenosylcobinamide-phosphate guanylyltransferase
MIRHQYHPNQLRVDTQIKIIEEDGTETTASVVVLVGLNKVEDKQQYNIYRIVNNAFNRDFTLDRRIKASAPKKPWWKLW